MITVLPFKAVHGRLLIDPEAQPGSFRVLAENPQYLAALEASGTAFSAFSGETFLGCAGWALSAWKTSAEVWVWEMPGVHDRPVWIHKIVVRAIRQLEAEGVERISCTVRDGNTRAYRWMDLLGFEHEVAMRKWGPNGETFHLYAKVRE